MPSFDIIKNTEKKKSFRADSIRGAFDITDEIITEQFAGNIDIENKQWNVGLIVGGSGTGKSTVIESCFKEYLTNKKEYSNNPVIDDMNLKSGIKDIQSTFTAVGFSSPKSWLKPYNVLSNGEKMRVDLADALLGNKDVIVFDEFTSVVNREVAKTCSFAVSKIVKKQDKKFIAVSCHSDIIEWLEPDWIYDTDKKQFFFVRGIQGQKSNLIYTKLTADIKSKFGAYSQSIII